MPNLNLQHLLWRAGFGPASADYAAWQALPAADWWPRLRRASAAPPPTFDVADGAIRGFLNGAGQLARMERDELTKEQKQQIRRESREKLKSINLLWLDEMTTTEAQLREKTALFWHGHFASRNINILYQQQLLDVARRHALGNFRELLRAVSKSAAMLAFLNNQQNKKQHPNENFAREVMELFTLGRGNYTETDVKEAARAFTGWGFRLDGEFVFRQRDHDAGTKTILGKTGRFTGDDVLDILLEQRQTARFITRKLYRYFVNEERLPAERIELLANRFYDSGYEIGALLDAIFTSAWFYDAENIGTKIKSPVELWVGIRRVLPLELEQPESQLLVQKALGQVLFFPPNVAGWPGGRSWIDSSSLMLRLRLPQLIFQNQALDLRSKTDDDQQMGEMRDDDDDDNSRSNRRAARRLAGTVRWPAVLRLFEKTPEAELVPALTRFAWQIPHAQAPAAVLERYTDRSSREMRLKSTLIQLMATPEYQLC